MSQHTADMPTGFDPTEVVPDARKYAVNHPSREFDPDGACHENAFFAADYLMRETCLTPHITVGVIARTPSQATPERVPATLAAAEQTGRIHHWVCTSDRTLHIDPWALPQSWTSTPAVRGAPLWTAPDPPEEYAIVETVPYDAIRQFSPRILTDAEQLSPFCSEEILC